MTQRHQRAVDAQSFSCLGFSQEYDGLPKPIPLDVTDDRSDWVLTEVAVRSRLAVLRLLETELADYMVLSAL